MERQGKGTRPLHTSVLCTARVTGVHLHPCKVVDLYEPQTLAVGLKAKVHASLREVEYDVLADSSLLQTRQMSPYTHQHKRRAHPSCPFPPLPRGSVST